MNEKEMEYIVRLRSKDEDALAQIIDLYLPLVKGIVSKVVATSGIAGVKEQAEDCISDIFFSVWCHIDQFTGQDVTDFKKWLCAIAKFRAIDFYRSASKRAESLVGDEFQWNDIGGQRKSAEAEMIAAEERKELEQLLNLLSAQDKQIFIMKFYWGMRAEEISQQLGLTKSAVDNRIYRGKKRLNKLGRFMMDK